MVGQQTLKSKSFLQNVWKSSLCFWSVPSIKSIRFLVSFVLTKKISCSDSLSYSLYTFHTRIRDCQNYPSLSLPWNPYQVTGQFLFSDEAEKILSILVSFGIGWQKEHKYARFLYPSASGGSVVIFPSPVLSLVSA